jgi:restriction system protein
MARRPSQASRRAAQKFPAFTDTLVGAPAVREFYSAVVADQAIKGIFITTSGFTQQAYEFANGLKLELINGSQLKQLFAENLLGNEANPR